MIVFWSSPFQILLLTTLSFFKARPLYIFYTALLLQNLALHRNSVLSAAILTIGMLLAPSFAITLLGLWTVSFFSRNVLYVRHDDPLPLLISILCQYLVVGILCQPSSFMQLILQTIYSFTYHIQGSLAWSNRYSLNNLLTAKKRPYLIRMLVLSLAALCAPGYAFIIFVVALLCFQWSYPVFWLFEEHFILTLLPLKTFMAAESQNILLSLSLLLYSVSTAFKGLHYDPQQPTASLERADFRTQHYHRSLPFSKKLFTPRM